MGGKNQTLIVVLVALVIVGAVFASFGSYLLPGQIPEVVLPSQAGTGESGQPQTTPVPGTDRYQMVEVTPDTVQSVIATLDRADSYAREITIRDIWGETEEEQGTTAVSVWVDGGFTRLQTSLASGRVQNVLMDDESVYLWYDRSRRYLTLAGEEESSDLLQRVPTYEDVLALDPEEITDAGYTVLEDGSACIYAEVVREESGYTDRYWVDISSGLLVRAETETEGRVVYRMTASAFQSPCPAAASFALPDGQVLHQVG